MNSKNETQTANQNFILSVLGAFEKLRNATVNFVMSVRPFARNNSAISGRIIVKFDI